MTDDEIEGFLGKVRQAHESYAKAMELLGIFSAGTIGFVVSLRPDATGADAYLLRIAVILLFITVLGAIVRFMGKGAQYMDTAAQIRAGAGGSVSSTEIWWVTAARVAGMASFVAAYIFLFFSM